KERKKRSEVNFETYILEQNTKMNQNTDPKDDMEIQDWLVDLEPLDPMEIKAEIEEWTRK
ncbi:18071_t:CDS:1, partial [Racocetra fulgida]